MAQQCRRIQPNQLLISSSCLLLHFKRSRQDVHVDDEYIVSAEEAAAILGISGKTLRHRLRDERPSGARQFPPQHGGYWFLKRSYAEQLAAQRGRSVPWTASSSGSRTALLPRIVADEEMTNRRLNAEVEIAHRVWSEWIPFQNALRVAPRFPGVYMCRIAKETERGPVYIGMAGERKGNGLRGRLAIYASGKGAASGLGEHAFDRALEDPKWLQARLDEALAGTPMRATAAARSAIDHAGLEVKWQTVETRAEAMMLEIELIREHRAGLWNR